MQELKIVDEKNYFFSKLKVLDEACKTADGSLFNYFFFSRKRNRFDSQEEGWQVFSTCRKKNKQELQ